VPRSGSNDDWLVAGADKAVGSGREEGGSRCYVPAGSGLGRKKARGDSSEIALASVRSHV
jgi:hypothetical protein